MATTRAPKSAPTTAQNGPVNGASPQVGGTVPATVSNASRAVALPADLQEELAEAAKEAAAKERPSVGKVSLKGGMMTYMNQALPDNKIDAVILAYSYRNAYYANPYDPNNIVNPNCFAIQESDEDMRPHENVSEPENETCDGCPRHEWGSDPRPGSRGKACKEGRRLILVPKDALADPEAMAKAEFAVVDVPVTSVRNFGNYVNQLSAAVQRPMWAVVTQLKVVPDPKTQIKLTFTPTEAINDVEIIQAIRARIPDAVRVALIPYDESYLAGEKTEQPPPPAPAKAAKFKAR